MQPPDVDAFMILAEPHALVVVAMISHFMAFGDNALHEVGFSHFADDEEGPLRVVAAQQRKNGVEALSGRPVIKGKSD